MVLLLLFYGLHLLNYNFGDIIVGDVFITYLIEVILDFRITTAEVQYFFREILLEILLDYLLEGLIILKPFESLMYPLFIPIFPILNRTIFIGCIILVFRFIVGRREAQILIFIGLLRFHQSIAYISKLINNIISLSKFDALIHY